MSLNNFQKLAKPSKMGICELVFVIDKFHVVRYVTWALENVRKRIQKQLHPAKRKYFKRSRKLLLTHKSKLKEESMDALAVMLS
ncbi:MAG: transposase, partial [Clostridium sp.]|nr:transposase [Clostridium sp.]